MSEEKLYCSDCGKEMPKPYMSGPGLRAAAQWCDDCGKKRLSQVSGDYDKDDLRPYRWYGFLIPPPGKWRGFLIESLSFMGYDKMNRREKLRFWLRFPGAWFSWGVWQPMISQAKRLYYAVRYRR